MKLTRPRYLFAFATVSLLACAVPAGSGGEDVGVTSEALCKDPPCGRVDPPPPPPPPPPAPTTHTATITSDELESDLVVLLGGSKLSIDTTGTSPGVFGPATTYPNPVYVQCSRDRNACTQNNPPGGLRKECLAEVNERCAGVPSSIRTAEIEHSYLQFASLAKSYGASDVFFPLETMHHDGAVFSFDIDINYIHADFGYNVHSGFQSGGVWLRLDGITSNRPTIRLSGEYPNFDFTNMSASVNLSSLAVTADGQSVDYGAVGSTFDFDWNADNFPDFLVSALVDVTSITKNRVTSRINRGFDKDATHAALTKAFAELAKRAVVKQDPQGYAKLTAVSVVGTSLLISYQPK